MIRFGKDNSFFNSDKKFAFFVIDSIQMTFQPKIAKTTPGKPAPLPKSIIVTFFGIYFANWALSRICRFCVSDSVLGATKFILVDHSLSNFSYLINFSSIFISFILTYLIMKEIKKICIGVILIAAMVSGSYLLWKKISNMNRFEMGQGEIISESDFGLFLATQHALNVNDFESAARMINMVKTDNASIARLKTITDFFNGKIPQNVDALKNSKDLIDGLIYDSMLIQRDDWKSLYNRHAKDETILAAPLRIFSGVKQGKTKEVEKFIDSLKTNDSWKSFVRGQIAVLNNDIDGAAKHFANVHPDFMNINDYLYLMSFYQENGMTKDMEILRADFIAKPGGMYVFNYPDIPDWSNYAGYRNNLVFSMIQNISHTQIMIYTDLSLVFLRFAQIISNESNMDAVNYYLGQYYFHNSGDYKSCYDKISKTSPLYLFSKLSVAEKNQDLNTIKEIARQNPLFVPAVQTVIREDVKNGDKNSALALLNRTLKHKNLPEEGKAHFLEQRAHVYLMFQDANHAQKDLVAAKEITGLTNNIMLLQSRVWLLQNRELDEAYNYAMALVKKNPSDVYAWDLVGQIVAKKEGIDAALDLMESVGAVATVSSLHEHLGDLYVQKGDKEKALRAYSQAIDLSDDCLVVVPLVRNKIRKLK